VQGSAPRWDASRLPSLQLSPLPGPRCCPKINLRCLLCLQRGHAEEDKRCGQLKVNLDLLELNADIGFVTENRFRQDSSGSGFYPILSFGQVRHINAMKGYSRLLALMCLEAE
jgi:hypothetical protein